MRLLLLLCLALSAAFAFPQDNALRGVKITTPPIVDGTIDEAEWKDVPSGTGSFDMATGSKGVDETQFWIAYDDNFIYFAARLSDSQPGGIKANEYRTNVSLSGDDFVQLDVDLSGSLADFNSFGINPRGATFINLAGGRAAKREWSGEFVAKGRITSAGWEVEAKIPWRIMRLPSAGPRTVRFNVTRRIPRTQRSYGWQYTNDGRLQNFGRWTEVAIPKAPFERTLKLLPYAYAGVDEKTGLIANGGLDLKTNLAEQAVLVGSINPDFRNIENSILSLDFSRFERLAGETRPFFQEGSQYFVSGVFASQRISSFDVGVNAHGRLSDRMSFGILNTIDFAEQNNFVGNVTYDPTPNDSYRLTATNLNRPGLENTGYLFRYNRVQGPYTIFVRNMGTSDTLLGDGLFNTLLLNYTAAGLNFFGGWDAVSPNFVPRLGFAPERDYKGYNLGGSWQKNMTRGFVRSVSLSGFWQDLNRFNGGHYRETWSPSASLLMKNGLGMAAFAFGEDFLGTYDRLYGVTASFPQGDPYRNVFVDYQWGRLALEDYTSVLIGGAYRPTSKLQITGSFQHVDHFEQSDLGIFGMNYDIGRDMYVSGRAVKRDDDWNAYLSFRRSGNKGAEYYVILGDPNARTFRTSLILKVVWPFEL